MLPDNRMLVLGVKRLKKQENKFVKRDFGQLLVYTEWVKENYSDYEAVPVSVHNNNKADSKLPTKSVYVLTLGSLASLLSEIKSFLSEVCRDGLSNSDLMSTCESSLKKHGLLYNEIIDKYLEQFEKV
jgi:hypothetical protein